MSSFIRRIQKRRPGLGKFLGSPPDKQAKDLLARLAREELRNKEIS